MNKQIVGIQGIIGSNHHKIITDFVSDDVNIMEFMSFHALVNSIMTQKIDYAIMAIENSIAGSILPNYKLISENNLFISEEYFLDIKHNLVGLKNQIISDIKQVRSHQMALLQCGEFFNAHQDISLIEDVDTALPARDIAKRQLKGIAALVPDGTAELFGLEVIKPHIQDNNLNSTRFVKISLPNYMTVRRNTTNKASICFELHHTPGALFDVLSILKRFSINMTKIQSIPKVNPQWNYRFYVDIIFDIDLDIDQILLEIDRKTLNFKILGTYNTFEK